MKKKNLTHLLAMTSILSLTSHAAYAQLDGTDKNLDSLMSMPLSSLLEVTVASKRPEKITEAPGVVSLITAEEIERFGYHNLYDVLKRLPNTYEHASPSFPESNLSIRAMDTPDVNHHTLILFNGRPVRDSQSGGFSGPMFKMFPVELIDHIEVIRGPGSVLYGTNAFAGVINIVTKERDTDGENVLLHGSYGSFDTARYGVAGNVKKGDFFGQASVIDQNSNGWRFDYTDPMGNSGNPSYDDDGNSIFFNMAYKGFTAQGYNGFINHSSLNQSFLLPLQSLGIRRTFLDVGYEQQIGTSSWDLAGNLTYNGVDHYGSAPITADDVMFELTADGELWERFNAVIGGTVEHHNASLKSIGGESDASWYSLYSQFDYRPVDSLKLIAGGQLNKVEGLDAAFSPRLGAIYHISERVGVKALYSEAFRSPTSADVALDLPVQIGDPDMKPETVKTADLQVFYEYDDYYFAATAYHSTIEDIVTQALTGPPGLSPLQITNGGEHDYQGIELEGKVYLNREWLMQGSVSYQTGDDNAGNDNDAGRMPNFMAKLGTGYAGLDNGLTFGLFGSYFGEPDNVADTAPPGFVVNNPQSGAYFDLSLNAGVKINHYLDARWLPETEFVLYADNLLDEEVYYPNFITQQNNTFPLNPGRTVYGKLKIRF